MTTDEKADILRAVFDALPALVFVVDQDVRIEEYNAAAAELLKAKRFAIIRYRTGEILHCIHARDVPEGCGKAPFCKDCIVRNSVTETFRGRRVVRRRTKLEFLRDGKRSETYALITASPFLFQNKSLALLVIEDINELDELHRVIPVCAVCNRVQRDEKSWMGVEAYFEKTWHVGFTHGLCPECYKQAITKLKSKLKDKSDVLDKGE